MRQFGLNNWMIILSTSVPQQKQKKNKRDCGLWIRDCHTECVQIINFLLILRTEFFKFRVYLDTAYFVKNEKLLLKVL